MDGVLEKAAVKRVVAALQENGCAGKIKVLPDSARTAAEAAAGHPHAVYPTSFAELLAITSAKPMVVGQ